MLLNSESSLTVCIETSLHSFTYSSTSIIFLSDCHQVQYFPSSPSHLVSISSYIRKQKLAAWSLPLDKIPHNAKCDCVTEVLLTSCPPSQSSSPKLLSSVYSSLGDKCGRQLSGWLNQVGWLLERQEVTGIEIWGPTVAIEMNCLTGEMWEHKWKIPRSFVANSVYPFGEERSQQKFNSFSKTTWQNVHFFQREIHEPVGSDWRDNGSSGITCLFLS